MNKIILTSHAAFDSLKSTAHTLLERAACFIQRKSYEPNQGPQWQQLELPFSRTPVKRWNR